MEMQFVTGSVASIKRVLSRLVPSGPIGTVGKSVPLLVELEQGAELELVLVMVRFRNFDCLGQKQFDQS